jgi:hypothetical protein
MFELDREIETWRKSLMDREAFRPVDLDELESHLRETVAALTPGGLSEEEAFGLGLLRIGQAGALEAEFVKANGGAVWARRLQWMLAGYLLVPLLLGVARLVATASVAIGARFKIGGTELVVLDGSVFALCVALWVALAIGLTRASSDGARRLLGRCSSWLASTGSATLAVAVLLTCVAGDLLPDMSRSLLMRQILGAGNPALVAYAVYVQPAIWLLSILALIGLSLRVRRLTRQALLAE